MNKMTLKECLRPLYNAGNLSATTLQRKFHFRLLDISRMLLEIVKDNIKEENDIDLIYPVLNLVIVAAVTSEQKFHIDIREQLNEIEKMILEKIKHKDNYDDKIMVQFKLCLNMFSKFYTALNSELVRTKLKELVSFEYIFRLIEEVKNPEIIKILMGYHSEFANSKDNEENSLIYHLVVKYLESFDEYYLSIIAIVLENLKTNLSEVEITSIKNKIEAISDEKRTLHLKNLLEHYLEHHEEITKSYNRLIAMSKKPEIITGENNLEKDRLDLTGLTTYLISKKQKDCCVFGVTPSIAISLKKLSESYELYFHIPCIPYRKKTMEDRSFHLIEGLSKKSPLFDIQSLERFGLMTREKRAAITFKMDISFNGTIQRTNAFKSFIKCDFLLDESVFFNTAKRTKQPELNEIITLCEKMYATCISIQNPEKLVDFLTDLLERNLPLMTIDNLPFIFRCEFPKSEVLSKEEIETVKRITSLYLNPSASNNIGKSISAHSQRVFIYSPKPLVSALTKRLTAPIANPEISLIALQNMRMIEELLIEKTGDRDYYSLSAMTLSKVANATDKAIILSPTNKRYLRSL